MDSMDSTSFDLHDRLAIAHAVVACIATLGTIPGALLIGRYCRSNPLWCRYHIILNSLTAFLITVCFGLGMGAVGSADEGTQFNGELSDLHHKAGLGVFIIVLVETLLGCFAHSTAAGKKWTQGGRGKSLLRWTHIVFGFMVASMCYWLVWEGMHDEWAEMSDSSTTTPEAAQVIFWIIFTIEVAAYVLSATNDILLALDAWFLRLQGYEVAPSNIAEGKKEKVESQDSSKEAFALFDKKGSGFISPDVMGDLLRALGQNPTQAEVEHLKAQVPKTGVDYNTFMSVLNREGGFESAGNINDFVKAFAVFDKENSGYIAVGEIKYILTQLGEKMEDNEVEDLLKMANVTNDGMVNYSAFISTILAA